MDMKDISAEEKIEKFDILCAAWYAAHNYADVVIGGQSLSEKAYSLLEDAFGIPEFK